MSGTTYDASEAPDPQEWLSLPEAERLRLVRNSHQGSGVSPTGRHHWLTHVAVENYLARGHGTAKRALSHLMSTGASRHDGIHRIGQALVKAYSAAPRLKQPEEQLFVEELAAILSS